MIEIDNLKSLLEKLKFIKFFERLFRWNKIRQMIMNAFADMQKMIDKIEDYENENQEIKNQKLVLDDKLKTANQERTKLEIQNETLAEYKNKCSANDEKIYSLESKKHELELELTELKTEYNNTKSENEKLKAANSKLLGDEEHRKGEYDKAVSNLNAIRNQIQNDRAKEIQDRNDEEIERLKKLKETWSNHQENVKNKIKLICSKLIIEYVDNVPFKGTPDNTIKICDEFIIFDAKSPQGDDLSNFPRYLKAQAESVKKYAKESSVKRDIYFVIPTNSLEVIENNTIDLADYRVYIISLDALEPIILSLKKIEEYEEFKDLSPEDRENICRVLGKFAHLSKRRIQIDSFFIKQFMELAIKSESDLPSEILEKVIEFEKAEKLNPPTEKRAKLIEARILEKDISQIRSTIDTQGIIVEDKDISEELNKLPLYKEQSPKNEKFPDSGS